MPHQQHPSSSAGLLTDCEQLEFLFLAEFVSNARLLDIIQAQIMSGEADIVGEESAKPIEWRLQFGSLMLVIRQITRSATLIPSQSTRLLLRLRTKYLKRSPVTKSPYSRISTIKVDHVTRLVC